MDKLEFLERLRMTLNGSVPSRVVEDNIRYYENYINSQLRMGYREEEVMSSLGDPRLIAKSIISANSFSEKNQAKNNDREVYDREDYVELRQKNELRVTGMPGWLRAVIVATVIIVIFKVIASVISALIPVVFPVLLVYFLVKLFRDWLN